MSNIYWGYAEEKHPDSWMECLSSREEAIAAGSNYFGHRDGVNAFWICSGYKPHANRYTPDAEDILEVMHERAYEEAGSSAEEFPRVTNRARRELNLFLSAWIETHAIECDFCIFDGTPEYIEEVFA